MDNNQSKHNTLDINDNITTNSIVNDGMNINSIVNDGMNINSDESIKQVPKSFYNSLLNHYYFNKKMMQEMKNTFSKKYLDMKDECEKLKIELKKYNMLKETENTNIDNVSTSSIFKKKEKVESDKYVLSQQGGNKSEKHVEIKIEKKVDSSGESDDDETEENTYDSSDETSDSSTSYDDTSDIYRATETEDGINKAYSKLNKEMEYISKSQNKGKMKKKEVISRINFLLNGLRILDNVKKNNKRKKMKI